MIRGITLIWVSDNFDDCCLVAGVTLLTLPPAYTFTREHKKARITRAFLCSLRKDTKGEEQSSFALCLSL